MLVALDGFRPYSYDNADENINKASRYDQELRYGTPPGYYRPRSLLRPKQNLNEGVVLYRVQQRRPKLRPRQDYPREGEKLSPL
ncbi:MAG: hypothetical protein ACE5NP_06160 [Anaerolineae bacterium]